MSSDIKLGDLYFGDLEAYDEARLHKKYFLESFVPPASVSPTALKNNNKFVIVGRKGAGKTAIQMHFADTELVDKGYFVQFFRFFEDMQPHDYTQITATQSHISYAMAIDEKKIFLNYDYRPVWERVFLNKISEMLIENGKPNKFTAFCSPGKNHISNIFQGISKALKVKLSTEMLGVAAEIGIDLSEISTGSEIPLHEHNMIARALFLKYCYPYRIYFFIDELVFSRLDATPDEIRVRAAMVRDIIRTCRSLNTDLALADIDIHFVCALRPEVRNMINELDSEIGKVIDGRDVALSWMARDEDDDGTLLDEVFERKIRHSHYKEIDPTTIVCKTVSFGNMTMTISEFLKTNTWGRPRDVVRLLQAIAKASPHSSYIGEKEIKAGLDEYSRASLKELFDELGVVFGHAIIKAIRNGITKRTYENKDAFWGALSGHLKGFNKEDIINELFQLGIIQGYLPNPPRYFAAHRGETYLKPHHKIRIHPALWNELGIRSN